MPKMKHPEGGTLETTPAYVEMYESQGWEKVTTPAKKAAARKSEPSSTTDAETK